MNYFHFTQTLQGPEEPNQLLNIVEKYQSDQNKKKHHKPLHETMDELIQQSIIQPAKHLLQRPGKSFRSSLVEMSWQISGGKGSCPEELMNTVELLHTGSLIVDDVQDDAETRRGLPALHRVYGMPLAINTGNWFYFVALSQLISPPPDKEASKALDAKKRMAIYQKVTETLIQCHKGQALDLSVDVTSLTQAQVPLVVRTSTQFKTGALTAMASYMGSIAATDSSIMTSALTKFGKHLGIALQMLDDLSGILNPSRMNKAMEDLKGLRPTWVWAFLASSLDEITFARIQKQAKEAIENDESVKPLLGTFKTILEDSGPKQIQSYLDHCFEKLVQQVGHSESTDRMQKECERLIHSYL